MNHNFFDDALGVGDRFFKAMKEPFGYILRSWIDPLEVRVVIDKYVVYG